MEDRNHKNQRRRLSEIIEIPFGDPRYPPLLARIADPPAVLYIRGDAALLRRTDMVAVVGTRKMTRYGQEAATSIAGALAEAGLPIVSGLALGIDAVAHEAALAANAPTIAVLAGGVEDASISPTSNFGLARRILESDGALVSEQPEGMESYKGNFLLRNRIVAGMCRATVVVEAAARSGALVTARLALEGNREVFAVPGQITSLASEGANRLIAQGAHPALSPAFVLETLGMQPAAGVPKAKLTDQECAVLEAMAEGARSPDDICDRTRLTARVVAAALASIALKGARK